MARHVGYTLHADVLSSLYGAVHAHQCANCYAHNWACNNHRTPRPATRRLLGIVPITADQARTEKFVCATCRRIIA